MREVVSLCPLSLEPEALPAWLSVWLVLPLLCPFTLSPKITPHVLSYRAMLSYRKKNVTLHLPSLRDDDRS